MDLVIPVKQARSNEELRYALRSIAVNLPHDQVWIVGYKPSWCRNVSHIPTQQVGTKYSNTTVAMRSACLHPEVSDTFLWCNDDFFTMKPIEQMPVYHRGPMAELETYLSRKYRNRGPYLQGLRQTRQLLERLGHKAPLSYEVHVPLPITKELMLRALDLGKHIPAYHKRTAYAVTAGLGGVRLRDPKILSRGPVVNKAGTFLSTTADSFRQGHVGAFIRKAFPHPGRYEGGT